MSKSALEEKMAFDMKCLKVPTPETQYRFHPERKWRFDMAWPWCSVAAEIEGGIWIRGAHTRGGHFLSDCEKYNTATKMGWKIFRFGPNHVRSGEAASFMDDVFKDIKS